MRWSFVVAAAPLLSGCGLSDWMTGATPPPPVTLIERTRVEMQVPGECWTSDDPAPPAWVERDETVDTRLSDEMRRENLNKTSSQTHQKTIAKRRRVCEAGLRVLVAR